MRVDIVHEAGVAGSHLLWQKVRDLEQYGPDIPAFRTSGIDMVEFGSVKTN